MVNVRYDSQRHQFVLQNGEPIENIHILEANYHWNTLSIQEMGSAFSQQIKAGPATVSIRAEYVEPDIADWKKEVEKIDKEAIRKRSEEIVSEFKRSVAQG